MKRIFAILFLTTLLLLFTGLAYAANDVQLEASWAWNGTDQTLQGFKFYLNDEVVQDVADSAARTATWTMPMENGTHTFSMSAYGPDWESGRSDPFNFEYVHVPDRDARPAPTVYIRIN